MSKAQMLPRFAGFVRPRQNWFKLPNEWTDITAAITSLAELKVVEYVLKHTWGYQEYGLTKQITTDEFMHGRRRKDGTRIDRGTGLSNRSVIDGLRKAIQHGYLLEEVNDLDRGRVKKYYALRMQVLDEDGESPSAPQTSKDEAVQTGVKILHSSLKNLHTAVENVHPRSKHSSYRTEKDTLERYFKPLNGNRSIFKKLPLLKQSKDKTEYVAELIMEKLKDSHSKRFYNLIAARIPEDVIRQALAEIKADGADNPPKLFTHKMKIYAVQKLKKSLAERGG